MCRLYVFFKTSFIYFIILTTYLVISNLIMMPEGQGGPTQASAGPTQANTGPTKAHKGQQGPTRAQLWVFASFFLFFLLFKYYLIKFLFIFRYCICDYSEWQAQTNRFIHPAEKNNCAYINTCEVATADKANWSAYQARSIFVHY
jgi:hypothetical protein